MTEQLFLTGQFVDGKWLRERLGGPHGGWGKAGGLASDAARQGDRLSWAGEVLDEAELIGAAGTQRAPGQQQVAEGRVGRVSPEPWNRSKAGE